jgi:hypothetical protein
VTDPCLHGAHLLPVLHVSEEAGDTRKSLFRSKGQRVKDEEHRITYSLSLYGGFSQTACRGMIDLPGQ